MKIPKDCNLDCVEINGKLHVMINVRDNMPKGLDRQKATLYIADKILNSPRLLLLRNGNADT